LPDIIRLSAPSWRTDFIPKIRLIKIKSLLNNSRIPHSPSGARWRDIILRMLWHGLVCDPRQDHRQGSAVLRLLPSESFFSVFILGINPTPCGKQAKKWYYFRISKHFDQTITVFTRNDNRLLKVFWQI
jgi:hypothetical protein